MKRIIRNKKKVEKYEEDFFKKKKCEENKGKKINAKTGGIFR
jgi:hypothetical protein